jgi:hypothetical protein
MAYQAHFVLFVIVFSATIVNSINFAQFARGKGSVGGGGDCAACTIVSSLVEQVSVKNEQSVGNRSMI